MCDGESRSLVARTTANGLSRLLFPVMLATNEMCSSLMFCARESTSFDENEWWKLFSLTTQVDAFEIEAVSLGKLRRLIISHDNRSPAQGWFLDRVIVRDISKPKNTETVFPCSRWVRERWGRELVSKRIRQSCRIFSGEMQRTYVAQLSTSRPPWGPDPARTSNPQSARSSDLQNILYIPWRSSNLFPNRIRWRDSFIFSVFLKSGCNWTSPCVFDFTFKIFQRYSARKFIVHVTSSLFFRFFRSKDLPSFYHWRVLEPSRWLDAGEDDGKTTRELRVSDEVQHELLSREIVSATGLCDRFRV